MSLQNAYRWYIYLFNEQDNTIILIGQKPIVYCIVKPIENSSSFLINNMSYFLLVYRLRLVIYKLFSCSPDIPRGLLRR